MSCDCWLCKEYRKQYRKQEIKALKKIIKLHFPELPRRGLRLGDCYDRKHRVLPPPGLNSDCREYFSGDGKRRFLRVITDEHGKPWWAAPWLEPLTSFEAMKLRPPVNGEFALHLLLSKDEQEAVIGDLIERYGQKCERFGEQRAKLWFYCEVLRSVWPLLRRAIARVGGLVAASEWIRRHLS